MRYDPMENTNPSISVTGGPDRVTHMNDLGGLSTDRPMESRDFE